MEQRRFGNTDLTTSAIGFGTWEMSGTMHGKIDAAAASRAAEQVPNYAGAPVMVRPDQQILSEGDD